MELVERYRYAMEQQHNEMKRILLAIQYNAKTVDDILDLKSRFCRIREFLSIMAHDINCDATWEDDEWCFEFDDKIEETVDHLKLCIEKGLDRIGYVEE